MLLRICFVVRIQFWYQVYQLSGVEGGCGASQQETPKIGLVLLLAPLVAGLLSLAT